MIISSNIKVGVTVPIFCDYFHKIKDYMYQLYEHDEKYVDDKYELQQLEINSDNEKMTMVEQYYYSYNDKLYTISFDSDLKIRDGKWSNETEIETLPKIKGNYIFDIEYYINNN